MDGPHPPRGGSGLKQFGDLPLSLALLILGAVTVVLVALAILLKSVDLWAVAIAVPIGLAVWYLYGYSRREGPEAAPAARPEEPFDDPVEEADRAASERAASQERADEEEEENAPIPPVSVDPADDADA